MENSIREDIKILENLKTAIDTGCVNFGGKSMYGCGYQEAIEHILSDYKRVLKENEEQKACIHILDNELKEINEKRKKQEIKIQELQKENEELKESKITYEKVRDIQEKNKNIVDNKYIPKQKIKDIIDRIDYDIEKTKEIIFKNTSVYATYRKNDYQIVRLRAMNTKSLDIKKRLQKLLESEKK